MLVVGEYGRGRTAAFASDLAPHWAPREFLDWPHYAGMWTSMLSWAAQVPAARALAEQASRV